MVVRIRLQRHGCKYRPFYRVAVANSARHVSKKVIEHVGTYDPLVDNLGNKQLRLNVPRIKYWLAVGAQPSPTVQRLLSQFQLAPRPPVRRDLPADVDLMRAMDGLSVQPRDARHSDGELAVRAQTTANPRSATYRQASPNDVFPRTTSLLPRTVDDSESSANANESASDSSATSRRNSHLPRLLHRYKPTSEIKPILVPFAPTLATFAAWQQARQTLKRAA